MVKSVGENTFQPKIGFKTRYGMVANPFAEGTTQGLGRLKTATDTTEELLQEPHVILPHIWDSRPPLGGLFFMPLHP